MKIIDANHGRKSELSQLEVCPKIIDLLRFKLNDDACFVLIINLVWRKTIIIWIQHIENLDF